jgi:hypothetical protein
MSQASSESISGADVEYIESTERDPGSVVRQAGYLLGGRRICPILRPALIGDGIVKVDGDGDELIAAFDAACRANRVSAFIPASGSGTRLFQSLFQLHRAGEHDIEQVRRRADGGDAAARDALAVLDSITEFAIWPSLQRQGATPSSLPSVLASLFGGDTRYAEWPKGLIPFHVYDDSVRTAVAEHLEESAAVMAGADVCRVHFTIAERHRQLFAREVEAETARLESAGAPRFQIDFSVQAPASDTIAIDLAGAIRRDAEGRIMFFPGGHGALLRNLQESGGDIVLIKNIDNIARAELLPTIATIRRRIGGLLLRVEQQVHDAIRRARAGAGIDDGVDLVRTLFGIAPRHSLADRAARQQFVIRELNRPIRVCGVVETHDHAGGRAFWADSASRGASLQLVEGAEVALDDPEQRELFYQSFHFNPVDIACTLRDVDGQPFDLAAFVESERAFVAQKALAGVPSLLYEHPGLWNGGMGLWNTVFIEIPTTAFNPVKTLADLRAAGHRRPT